MTVTVDRDFGSGSDGQRALRRLDPCFGEQETGQHRIGDRKGQSVLSYDGEERERFRDRHAESASFFGQQSVGKAEFLQRRPKLLRQGSLRKRRARGIRQDVVQDSGRRRAQHIA